MTSGAASGRPCRDRLAQLGDLGRDPLGGQLGAAEQHGPGRVAAPLGGDQPERRENAAGPGAENPLHAQLLGEGCGVHRPGAAERQQGEAARVDAALHGDHAKRSDHLLVRHPDDPLRRLQLAEPERRPQPLDRVAGRVHVQLDATGEGRRRVQVAEQEVRVGDRGLGAAAGVAGGAGIRPGRLWPDPKRAAVVEPADRAAAGADRVDVDHRQLDHPAADLAGVGAPHPAALHHADVARGAAHVQPHRVSVRGERRQQAGADRAARGAREHAPGPGPCGLRGGRHPARGPHHERLRQAALGAGLGEPSQVAAEQGGEVGVDHGGRAALVLAKLRQHLVRDRDVEAGELGAQALGDGALVRRVEV